MRGLKISKFKISLQASLLMGIAALSFISLAHAGLEDTTAPKNTSVVSWMDYRALGEMKQNYELMISHYENRKAYGLWDFQTEAEYQQRVQEYGKGFLHQIKNSYTQTQLKQLKKEAARNKDLRPLRSPAIIIATLVAAYIGSPIDVSLGEHLKVGAYKAGQSHVSNVQWDMDVFRASVHMSSKSQDPQAALDDNARNRYKVSLARGLPVWDMSGDVSYGANQKAVTAAVSKPIIGNLTCIVGSTYGLGADDASRNSTEESVRLTYGLRF